MVVMRPGAFAITANVAVDLPFDDVRCRLDRVTTMAGIWMSIPSAPRCSSANTPIDGEGS